MNNLFSVLEKLSCAVRLYIKMTAPMERIQTLDSIEKDIILCLQSAG